MKLDAKADRSRVHELASDMATLRLQVALNEQIAADFRELQPTVDSLVAWRNRLAGAVVVLTVLVAPVAVAVIRDLLPV